MKDIEPETLALVAQAEAYALQFLSDDTVKDELHRVLTQQAGVKHSSEQFIQSMTKLTSLMALLA